MKSQILFITVVLGAVAAVARGDDRSDLEFFETKIRPVLVKQCYQCHSSDAAKAGKLKGGLQLDTREGVLKGGESGVAVVDRKPAESLLIQSIKHAGDAPNMPPDQKLPDSVIADFVEWIRIGLPDPRTGSVVVVKRGMSVDEGRKWWSMIPPRRTEPPTVTNRDWPRTNVDRFVLSKLEAQHLDPVTDADRVTLIRRVYFDLIGLPPSPENVEAYLLDSSSGAFAAVVDELLDSPRFGERWGRHWLDAARYADSNGRDRNILWYHAWRFRNYVISSFNANKPFDQFIREQIAGDLLLADSAAHRDELRIATGFLALGPKAFEELKPEIFRMDVIDEQIEIIGRSILGLSIGCARCHDHKFDPIPTRDYYALAAIFRSTQPLYGHGPRGIKATQHNHTPLIAIGPDADRFGPSGLAYFETLNDLNLKQNTARSDRYRVVRRLADARNQLKAPGADMAGLQADIDRMEADIKEWDIKVKAAEAEFQAAMDLPKAEPGWAMGVRDREQPEDCRVHIRGETTNLGDSVPRGALQVLPNVLAEMPTSSSGRLELANWLTSRDNPLTARVLVNRVWLHLFGKGLVTTPDDFGVNGSRPSHPELLDDLSVRFMDEGWSIKTLIRELVLSRTYQLASTPNSAGMQVDPETVWLWRMPPRRLEVECLRDAMMTVSGQLDLQPPAVNSEFLAKRNPHRDAEFFNFAPPFKPHEIVSPYRSVYLPVVRGVLPTMFPLFDFAAGDRPVAQRDESTVPAQALFMMNNAWVIDQSQHAARRLLAAEELDDVGRIHWLFRLAFARAASEEEIAAASDYLSSGSPLLDESKLKTSATFDQLREARWSCLIQATFASAEFRTLK